MESSSTFPIPLGRIEASSYGDGGRKIGSMFQKQIQATLKRREEWLEGLRAYAQESQLYDDVFYWAPTQAKQVEVDFLLRRDDEFLALEIKSSRRFSRSWTTGLRAIGELPGVVRRMLVYAGTERLTTEDGIEVWPVSL